MTVGAVIPKNVKMEENGRLNKKNLMNLLKRCNACLKVQLFPEDRKNLRNIPHGFDVY